MNTTDPAAFLSVSRGTGAQADSGVLGAVTNRWGGLYANDLYVDGAVQFEDYPDNPNTYLNLLTLLLGTVYVGNSAHDLTLLATTMVTCQVDFQASFFIPQEGYKSTDLSVGITQDVTTASLVGKTMVFKDGLLVGFA